MKRFATLVLCVVLLLGVLAPSVAAAPASMSNETVTVFPDGSYCITRITSGNDCVVLSNTNTKTGSKTADFYSALNTLLFSVTVTGTFTYNGSTAKCTSSTYSYQIHNSSCSFVSATPGFTGATAYVNATFKYLLSTRDAYVELVCSPTGVLS